MKSLVVNRLPLHLRNHKSLTFVTNASFSEWSFVVFLVEFYEPKALSCSAELNIKSL